MSPSLCCYWAQQKIKFLFFCFFTAPLFLLSLAGLQKSLVQCVVICRNNYWILLRVHLCDDGGDDGKVTGNDQTSHGSGRTRTSRPARNEWLKTRGSIEHQMWSRFIPWVSTSLKCHMKECSVHKSYSWIIWMLLLHHVFLVAGCEGWSIVRVVSSRSTDTYHYQRLRGGQPRHDNINSMSCVGWEEIFMFFLGENLRPESGSDCDLEARCGGYLYLLFKSSLALNITMI